MLVLGDHLLGGLFSSSSWMTDGTLRAGPVCFDGKSCVGIGAWMGASWALSVISSGPRGRLGKVLCAILLFVFCSLALGVAYQFSSKSAAVGIGLTVDSSIISGIGVLLRVCRWWMRLLARTTLGAVVFLDVVGTPTL